MTTSYVKAEMLISADGTLSLKVYDGEGRDKIYRDITRDVEALRRFIRAINFGEVSDIHIGELVEDFLG